MGIQFDNASGILTAHTNKRELACCSGDSLGLPIDKFKGYFLRKFCGNKHGILFMVCSLCALKFVKAATSARKPNMVDGTSASDDSSPLVFRKRATIMHSNCSNMYRQSIVCNHTQLTQHFTKLGSFFHRRMAWTTFMHPCRLIQLNHRTDIYYSTEQISQFFNFPSIQRKISNHMPFISSQFQKKKKIRKKRKKQCGRVQERVSVIA